MSTKHLRPAADTLTRTADTATWRNARGHSFVAMRDGVTKGTTTDDWEIYRVKIVECDGVIEHETAEAVKDADIITTAELEEIIG